MSQAEFDVETWRSEIEQYRGEKDDYFAEHPQSPLPREEREGFDGLAYFDPDPAYRVEAEVELVDEDDTITMETTADTEVEYERVARLHFELDGEEYSLVAYQQADGQGASLFVPFRDKTTGQQTYGAGRYMEFEVGEARSASENASGERSDPRAEGSIEDVETVTLDFNLAYHPFCAYNEAFACPLPPQENWLETVVEAGEKLPN
ncbi:DUF1684 domain-containing protein [Natronomonas sp. EA1]|uniref:DUF1684 domain-containing protein n=1 Tax=Natronomonas sp. EA1 TaxID=3421655 RepID=UPI003EB75F1D